VDAAVILITVAAGVAMGAINNLAGGAGVFGLLAFEHACGLPLVVANPSLRPAAVCVGVFSFLGYLRAGRRVPRSVWLQGLLAVPGAPIGSWLALHLPDLVFWIYLSCVLLLLLVQQARPSRPAGQRRPRPRWMAAVGCLLIGVHMGYAQIGVGLLSTLTLAATLGTDLVAITAAKSTIVILTSIASVGTFSTADAVAWEPALWLALGTAVGAYQASRWAVAKGSDAVRLVVLVVTAAMLAYAVYRMLQLLAHGNG